LLTLKWINFAVWLFILLLTLTFIYIILSLIKQKQKKDVIRGLWIFISILIPLVFFYVPVNIPLYDEKQLIVTIERNGQYYNIVKPEDIKELKQLVEKQRFIRSTNKTLLGVPSYPADQGINIRLAGWDFSYLLFVRSDDAQYSYLMKDSQYYSIWDTENLVSDIEKIMSRYSTIQK
jgi:hypothetical protein